MAVLFSQYVQSSAVSVAMPRSASTPQVGSMSITTLRFLERSKFQTPRPDVEVPCSGVLLGSSAQF